MSTNDDSASRRGRRSEEPDWRTSGRQPRDDRWDQSSPGGQDSGNPYHDQRGRGNQSQRAAYSGYTRPAYTQPRQEQAPPPPPQPARGFEPPQTPQGYYQEPVQRQEPPRYVEPAAPAYVPPPQAYEPEPPHPGYGDSGRDDLFGREPSPLNYDQNPYGSQGGYQPAPARRDDPAFYQREAPSPSDDYERTFASRIAAQENQASRFFLPDEPAQPRPAQPERGYAPPPPVDRGYAPSQPQYHQGGYNQNAAASESYGHDQYDQRYAGQQPWAGEEQGFHGDDASGAHRQLVPQGDELDEDFFADEDDFDHDHHYDNEKRGRKKLIVAALAGAIVVGGGGAYLYKMVKGGGEGGTPFIGADNKPFKESPGNPGGRQFPNGEKAIYDRLTPDGQQAQASFAPPSAPLSVAEAAAVPANTLEGRIEEALKKARGSGGAPALPDEPTKVRPEIYRPDGTRVDTARPLITPSIVNLNNGQLPPPFDKASTPPAAVPPQAAPFRTAGAVPSNPPPAAAHRSAPTRVATASAPQPAVALPAAAAPAASGFYVSLRSAPDEKAIQRDLPALSGKYKAQLGDVQLTVKIADLGAKGVTYRAVAGPLGTRQEAMDLCQKIKGAGGGCFVTN